LTAATVGVNMILAPLHCGVCRDPRYPGKLIALSSLWMSKSIK
jgi:hypothetical protein